MVMFTLAVGLPAFLAGYAIAKVVTSWRANAAFNRYVARKNWEEVDRLHA